MPEMRGVIEVVVVLGKGNKRWKRKNNVNAKTTSHKSQSQEDQVKFHVRVEGRSAKKNNNLLSY